MNKRRETYHFQSIWNLNASSDRVWRYLAAPSDWDIWWRGLISGEVQDTTSDEMPQAVDLHFKSPIGYGLSFSILVTKVLPLRAIYFHAIGDLRGEGDCILEQSGQNKTQVTINWNVETTKQWINTLAPVLRPIFVINHRLLMAAGRRGLSRELRLDIIQNVNQ